jgi:hypothetical protein
MSSLMHLESELEIVAKLWLKRRFGLETIKTSFAFESKGRHYEIDLYGSRREGWKNSPHYFAVNCITHKVKKTDFVNFNKVLLQIHNTSIEGLQDWYADYALIFSDTGFTSNAITWAKEKGFGAYLKVDTEFKELSRPMQLYY